MMNDDPELVPKSLARELSTHPARTHALSRGRLPSLGTVATLLEETRNLLFGELAGGAAPDANSGDDQVAAKLHALAVRLDQELRAAYEHGSVDSAKDAVVRARTVTRELLRRLPDLRLALMRDAEAALAGDPAASNLAEVVLAYPGHYAVTAYRLAHALHELGAPLLPRMITEYAHRVTGIDIHPGATVGDWFFIDHGTGVVIGETAVIGARVRLYQGVTLGALSLPASRVAELRHGPKRHPTLEDDVVVYAGATILGGATVIGQGSVVGGNCWVVASVPPGSRVTVQTQVDIRSPNGTNGDQRIAGPAAAEIRSAVRKGTDP